MDVLLYFFIEYYMSFSWIVPFYEKGSGDLSLNNDPEGRNVDLPGGKHLVEVNEDITLKVDNEVLDSDDKKKLSSEVIEMKKNENIMKLEHWISKKYFIIILFYFQNENWSYSVAWFFLIGLRHTRKLNSFRCCFSICPFKAFSDMRKSMIVIIMIWIEKMRNFISEHSFN